jgi:hypothetical protein
MTAERRDRKNLRRRRDELLETLYDAAKYERRRLGDQLAIEFRVAVDALAELDAIEERERRQQRS